MNRGLRFVFGWLSLVLLSSSSAIAQFTFTDDFEASTLNPFWTVQLPFGGTHTVVPSAERPHTGSQSAKFNTVQVAGEKHIALVHNFDQSIYGDVSVWVYDSGADLSSSNYLNLIIRNSAENRSSDIVSFDYDLTPANGGSYYFGPWRSGINTPPPTNSGVDRTLDWHEWKISTRPDLLQFEIDGQVVYSSSDIGLPFDQVGLYMFGPQFRPPWIGYYDDFRVVEIPEPTAWTLAIIGGMAVLTVARLRKRMTQAG